MDFINAAVNLDDLPAFEKLSLNAVQPSFKKVLRIEWLITTIVVLLIATAVIISSASLRQSYAWLIILLLLLLFFSFYYISLQKSFRFLAYAVREKDVIHQKGWIIRRIKACPFNRIQNCSVQSGPLERKFGLASLTIYTAGTNGADMRISGLLQEEAEQLRHFILHKIHTEPDETV